jgi:hypothetical protein
MDPAFSFNDNWQLIIAHWFLNVLMIRVLKFQQDAHPCGPSHRHPFFSQLQGGEGGFSWLEPVGLPTDS